MNSAVSTAVKTALPVVTSAATAYVMRRTRLPRVATPVVSLVVGGAVAKLAQRIR
jgi:ABC-type glycerol-3-phosphate transport system permease component